MTATDAKSKVVRYRTNFSKVIIEVEGKFYWFSLTRQGVVIRRWHSRNTKLLSFSQLLDLSIDQRQLL